MKEDTCLYELANGTHKGLMQLPIPCAIIDAKDKKNIIGNEAFLSKIQTADNPDFAEQINTLWEEKGQMVFSLKAEHVKEDVVMHYAFNKHNDIAYYICIFSFVSELASMVEHHKSLPEDVADKLTLSSKPAKFSSNIEMNARLSKIYSENLKTFFSGCKIKAKFDESTSDEEIDQIELSISTTLKQAIRQTDAVLQLSHDEFVLLFFNCRFEIAETIISSIINKINAANHFSIVPNLVRIVYSIEEFSSGDNITVEEIIKILKTE